MILAELFLTLVASGCASPEHRIRPGDEIQIRVWRDEADHGIPYRVREDGKLTLPLVGDMAAAGRTPAEVLAEVETRLGTVIREPQVRVYLHSCAGVSAGDLTWARSLLPTQRDSRSDPRSAPDR